MNNYETIIKDLNQYSKSIEQSKAYRLGNKLLLSASYIKKLQFIKLFQKIRSLKWSKSDMRSTRWKEHVACSLSTEFSKELNPASKIVVYSCITGNYDAPISAGCFGGPNIKYVLYTDKLIEDPKGWEVRQIPEKIRGLSPIAANRYLKLHPHEFFFADYSIYIDGNIWMTGDPKSLCLASHNADSGMALFSHAFRDDVFDETTACIRLKRGDKKGVKKQASRGKELGVPRHSGLFEAGVIATDLGNTVAKKVLECWWDEFLRYDSGRDQVAFIYALKALNVPVDSIGILGCNIREDDRFILKKHLVD